MILPLLLFVAQVEVTAEIKAEYRARRLTIGDPFEITLTVTYPPGTEISGPVPVADSLGPLVMVDQQQKTVEHRGRITDTYEMRFVPFATGPLRVPGFKFLLGPDGAVDTLSGNEIVLNVASVLPEDMADINDIKKAIEFPNILPLVIALALIGVAILGSVAYRLLRHWRRRAGGKPRPEPWVEAIIALENIPVGEWLAKGMIKRYYYALSEILKRYLERRYGFNAAEETTSEIVADLKARKIRQREEFNRFFTRADMVKYAKYVPPREEIDGALLAAKELVNTTRPEPVTAEER